MASCCFRNAGPRILRGLPTGSGRIGSGNQGLPTIPFRSGQPGGTGAALVPGIGHVLEDGLCWDVGH